MPGAWVGRALTGSKTLQIEAHLVGHELPGKVGSKEDHPGDKPDEQAAQDLAGDQAHPVEELQVCGGEGGQGGGHQHGQQGG
jgi:hypothetical protein